MKSKFSVACLLVGSLLVPMSAAYADDDIDQSHPVNFIKDSAITTAIKSKLAAEHLKSLKNIKVDTDDHGVVWLSGSASTQMQVDRAGELARQTDGVKAVKNHIIVRADG
jgi:hyperosmotically inducible protein